MTSWRDFRIIAITQSLPYQLVAGTLSQQLESELARNGLRLTSPRLPSTHRCPPPRPDIIGALKRCLLCPFLPNQTPYTLAGSCLTHCVVSPQHWPSYWCLLGTSGVLSGLYLEAGVKGKTDHRSQCSPSTIWGSRTTLRSSELVLGVHTH